MRNWALVLQGGAMRTSYTSGVLQYLDSQKIYPSVVCGSSAGILNALYYLSGQSSILGDLWTASVQSVLNTKWLYSKGYVFDNEKLFEIMSKGNLALDVDAFEKRGTPLFSCVLDADTYDAHFITVTKENLRDSVLATIAHPMSHPSPYEWNGKKLLDGGFYYPTCVESLWGLELDAILVVRNDIPAHTRNSLELTPLERMHMRTSSDRSRLWKMYNRRVQEENVTIREMQKRLTVKSIYPSSSLKAKLVSENAVDLRENITLGYSDAEKYLSHFIKNLSL